MGGLFQVIYWVIQKLIEMFFLNEQSTLQFHFLKNKMISTFVVKEYCYNNFHRLPFTIYLVEFNTNEYTLEY